jgi:hypothetical protein
MTTEICEVCGDAMDIDRGIRETIKGIRLSILAMGLGLAKIKEHCLYRELGFSSMAQYIQKLCDDTKMNQSSVFNWLYVGEAYQKYRNDLEQIDFNDSDGPTKLPYLERALGIYQKQEVFDKLKNLSVREFAAFSKGSAEKEAVAPYVTVRGNRVYVDGIPAVKINRRLGRRAFAYFKKVISIAGKAMEEGEIITLVRLRDRDEALRYEQASRRLIEKLRKNT